MTIESQGSTTIANSFNHETLNSTKYINPNKFIIKNTNYTNFNIFSKPKLNLNIDKPNNDHIQYEKYKNNNSSIINISKYNTFQSLKVPQWLIDISETLQIKKPTKIQQLCLPSAFSGKNLIGCSETGTGKTICFCWPILVSLSKNPYGVFSLILTPTRELAYQILDQFKIFSINMNINICSCVGGVDIIKQSMEMEHRPHIIIGTPGRLSYQVSIPERNISKIFSNVKYLVLDESDRLLDKCFEKSIKCILNCLPKTSDGRITFMFSATITDSIKALSTSMINTNFEFYDATEKTSKILKLNKKIEHEYIFLPQHVHLTYMVYLLNDRFLKDNKSKGIIFTSTKKRCQLVSLTLEQLKFNVTCIHSLMKQSKRNDSLSKFRSGYTNLLVATDLVSRGIDVPEVSFIINLDFPSTPIDYIHRIGRTGRGGRGGKAFSFIDEFDIEKVKKLESSIDIKLNKYEISDKEAVKLLNKVTIATQRSYIFLEEKEYNINK